MSFHVITLFLESKNEKEKEKTVKSVENWWAPGRYDAHGAHWFGNGHSRFSDKGKCIQK